MLLVPVDERIWEREVFVRGMVDGERNLENYSSTILHTHLIV
jgi:hypothetical protein